MTISAAGARPWMIDAQAVPWPTTSTASSSTTMASSPSSSTRTLSPERAADRRMVALDARVDDRDGDPGAAAVAERPLPIEPAERGDRAGDPRDRSAANGGAPRRSSRAVGRAGHRAAASSRDAARRRPRSARADEDAEQLPDEVELGRIGGPQAGDLVGEGPQRVVVLAGRASRRRRRRPPRRRPRCRGAIAVSAGRTSSAAASRSSRLARIATVGLPREHRRPARCRGGRTPPRRACRGPRARRSSPSSSSERHRDDRARHVAGLLGRGTTEAGVARDVRQGDRLAGREDVARDALVGCDRQPDDALALRPGRDLEDEAARSQGRRGRSTTASASNSATVASTIDRRTERRRRRREPAGGLEAERDRPDGGERTLPRRRRRRAGRRASGAGRRVPRTGHRSTERASRSRSTTTSTSRSSRTSPSSAGRRAAGSPTGATRRSSPRAPTGCRATGGGSSRRSRARSPSREPHDPRREAARAGRGSGGPRRGRSGAGSRRPARRAAPGAAPARSSIRARNASRWRTSVSVGSIATIVAEWGAPSRIASSPKNSPGPRIGDDRRLGALVATAGRPSPSRDATTNSASPGSPWWKTVSPLAEPADPEGAPTSASSVRSSASPNSPHARSASVAMDAADHAQPTSRFVLGRRILRGPPDADAAASRLPGSGARDGPHRVEADDDRASADRATARSRPRRRGAARRAGRPRGPAARRRPGRPRGRPAVTSSSVPLIPNRRRSSCIGT